MAQVLSRWISTSAISDRASKRVKKKVCNYITQTITTYGKYSLRIVMCNSFNTLKKDYNWWTINSSDGSRSKNFDPGRVSHLWFGFGFGKFPLKTSNFSIFSPFLSKKISSGWVKKYPGQGGSATYLLQVKSKWVGSGLISKQKS